jgi:uncharacterized membrane protein YjjP (DUF1212 family)
MSTPRPDGPTADSAAFILTLGRALHAHGTPAHRLEAAMAAVAERLGIAGQFFSLPTAIFVSFAGPERDEARFVRVEPGDVNLEKLTLLDSVADRVVAGDLSVTQGLAAVHEIVAAPPRYGGALTTLCFGLASATAARFFGGGVPEIATAGVIGLATGLLALVTSRHRRLAWVFEPAAATLAAALAVLVRWLAPPVAVPVAILAGLIVLIPGLTLTVAMNELAMRNLVSGTARLAAAVVVFVEMGFGVTLGGQLARWLPAAPAGGVAAPLPLWTEAVALLVATLALAVLFRARPADAGWIVAAGALAFWGARGGAWLLGPELGVAVGALFLGIAGNLHARLLDRPAAVLLVPGLMLLVPGSIGFRSVSSLAQHDVVVGVETAFTAVMVAVALVAGLLLANALVPPRRSL